MVIIPNTWTRGGFIGTPATSYTQIPLILAWAVTIHKS